MPWTQYVPLALAIATAVYAVGMHKSTTDRLVRTVDELTRAVSELTGTMRTMDVRVTHLERSVERKERFDA